ncbi:putative Murein transglycosylase [Seiridium cardinale]|uniref:Murein transglycosylase n=1 Tax=Seiridium cardinale TaxID=138064 RepID=A0ABR2XD44_9PEZI
MNGTTCLTSKWPYTLPKALHAHKWFEDNAPAQYNKKYPWQWRMHMHMHVFRGIRGITMAEYMIPEWADYFKGKSFEELDEIAASWKFENCMQRENA